MQDFARSATAVFALCICCLSNAGAHAQQADDDDIVVTVRRINPVRDANTPLEEIRNCLLDGMCGTAAIIIANKIRIPANAVRAAVIAVLTTKPESEETHYALPALSGRKICRVQVQTTSVVPATGDRATRFSITATPDIVDISTSTPRQRISTRRAWYDGNVFVAQVKAELSEEYTKAGRCDLPLTGNPVGYECQGATGVNHGLAACSSKDL